MKVSNSDCNISFKNTVLSSSVLGLVAQAKGVCPLHKKPLLEEAIKTMTKTFSDGIITKTGNKVYYAKRTNDNMYIPVRELSFLTGDKVNDVRSISAGVEWAKIGLKRFLPITKSQRTAIEKFKNKWRGFFNNEYSKRKSELAKELKEVDLADIF